MYIYDINDDEVDTQLETMRSFLLISALLGLGQNFFSYSNIVEGKTFLIAADDGKQQYAKRYI